MPPITVPPRSAVKSRRASHGAFRAKDPSHDLTVREPRSQRNTKDFGEYRVHELLATGGLGAVHLGIRAGKGPVSIERIPSNLAADADFVKALITGARAAKRVNHENVAAFVDLVIEEDRARIVTEYVHGVFLHDLQERPPLRVALSLFAALLRGLDAIHNATSERAVPLRLVHGDIARRNIAVGVDGVARILGTGFAPAIAMAQRKLGLPAKLACLGPDHLTGDPASVTGDIFAAASVGWELLTGRPLFQMEKSFGGIFRAPPPPSSINAAVPAAVDAVVMRGLSAEPSKRFESAREMLEALAVAEPFAPPSEIGAWIARAGFAEISRRDAIVTTAAQDAIEESPRSSVKPVPPPPAPRQRVNTLIGLGTDEEAPVQSTVRPRLEIVVADEPEPELRPRRGRTVLLLLAVLILALTVMALVLNR
jgi:serine/threonine-protein kinase